jgi:SAM-dependent methyltransferase
MATSLTQTTIDAGRAEAFGEKLLGIINGGTLSLMISIGHRAGLFDTMATLPPSTSREIAAAANLDERYVREWLGAMTVGGIVTCDGAGTEFHLPAEHAASLTRAAGADNVGIFAQYVGILGGVENEILECFRNGGGVPYEAYDRFHEVMAEDSGQSVLPALLDEILPLAPGVTEALERGIDVLDVGCGRGKALNLLASTFPESRFVGYDLSREAIDYAREEAKANGSTNVTFEARDMTTFDARDAFDLVTAFDAIHDQKAPDRVLAAIARSLRPGGTFLMQDIAGSSHVHKNMDHPLGPTLYTVSCMHCMTVSLAQGGAGLGAMWGEEKAYELLRQAGFGHVEKKNLPHDIQNNYYVVKVS